MNPSRNARLRPLVVVALVVAMALVAFVGPAPGARADHDTLPWRLAANLPLTVNFTRSSATVLSDQHGYLYVFYVTFNAPTGVRNLNVTKYAARGFNDNPVRLFDEQVNVQTNLVGDSAPSATMDADGNIYVAYTEVRTGLADEVYVSTSTDGGVIWAPEVLANGPNHLGIDTLPTILTAPNGTLYVAWRQIWGTFVNYSVSWSADGGASFADVGNVTQGPLAGNTGYGFAVDGGGRLYLIADARDLAAKYYKGNLTWSDDGITWSPPVTVSEINSNLYYPTVLADPFTGRIHVAWLDTVAGRNQLWYSSSDNRGITWTPSVTITMGASAVGISRVRIAVSAGTLMVVAQPNTLGGGLVYSISPDDGRTWYPEQTFVPPVTAFFPTLTADQNGTFYSAMTLRTGTFVTVGLGVWVGPPAAPVITRVAAGNHQLAVSWTANPEPNVVGYRLWRSVDGGATYALVTTVAGDVHGYADAGLVNGTYWYKVEAVADSGILSHPSQPASGVVGTTPGSLADQIAALQAEIAALKASQDANNASTALLINQLQQRLDQLQSQQATQTLSYANLAFEIIVVVLLVILLLNQMRKPKTPTIMMAQPGQTEPKPPEIDL